MLCWLWCREETIDFLKDDLYVVRYKSIRGLLKDGWVKLV